MAKTALMAWLSRQVQSSVQSDTLITRREFLKGMGAVAGLGLLAAASPWEALAASKVRATHPPAPKSVIHKPPSRHVVIVGGGLAGLATAFYLREQGIGSTIYEASNRLGGRVFTQNEGVNADGLSGEEGTFVICSFWLVSALALAGEVEQAEQLFDQLAGYANDLGLLAEEIDTANNEQLGNFPQAFSHIGLITAAARVDEARAKR